MFLGGGGEDGTTKEVMRGNDVKNTEIQNGDVDEIGDAENTQVGQDISKADLLADLMRKPETYDKVDSAWRLVMWLMMVENGIAINSYENIANQLGNISKSSVRKWADSLIKSGVIERTQKGNQVELKLCGEYMQIATAPNEIHVSSQVLPPVPKEMRSLRKIFDGTEELGGNFSIRIEGLRMGVSK